MAVIGIFIMHMTVKASQCQQHSCFLILINGDLLLSVHIAKDRETNQPRGFAFVTFSSSTDCNKACEGLDGKVS